jgi:uncharacterized protein YdhG (YjbR/CyaY superfamily)
MSVIDDYLASLSGPEKQLLGHMYAIVREVVPEATEETSYAMPAFKYHGEAVASIFVRDRFISLYPFCGIARLGLDLGTYETTSGSIHFTVEHPLSDELLKQIIIARVRLITA